MPARPITADDLYLFRWLDHVRFSPDGKRAALQVSWGDRQARENRGLIRVIDLASGEAFDATAGRKRDHSPEWTADGRLLFLRRKSGRDQLFSLPAGGGDAAQLTSLKDGVGAARWAPDARSIAFLGAVLADPDGVVDDPRPPESEDTARRPPVARVVRRLDYKHDGSGYVDGRHHHLHLIPAEGGEPRRLTDGAWSVEGFAWSPDSRSLVLVGDAGPDPDLNRAVNVYTVAADGTGGLRQLASGLQAAAPAWSPKGDLIAFVAAPSDAAGLHERIWVVPADGSAEARCLTAGFDAAVGGSVITDMRGGHGTRIAWDAAGERVYFLASRPGIAELYSVDLAGEVRTEVAADKRVIYDFDIHDGRLVYLAADPTTPGELYLDEGGERRLTDSNPWLEERFVALPERHEFTGPDGVKIEGWLLRPDGQPAPGERLPLVMEIHGGPHGQYGWSFFHEFQMLAGQGFLVFYCNPRGSDGYGEEFKKAVVRDWGGRDYEDLMAALDQLIERTGLVDEARMGVGGGSYGGYMTNWIVGHTDRFSAAVSMRSISNLMSEFAQHDIVLWGVLEMGPPPWPDPDELWRRSPIRYVNEIRTPLLLTHGEMDLRCAISQAEELFGALRLLGREVELVRFPGESHDLSRSGRPDRRVERLERIGGWFGRHLLGASEAAEVASLTTG